MVLTGFAFWSGYLSDLGNAPLEFHLHGVTAFLWMVLVAVQSWTIHKGQRELHRSVGFMSLGLFPFFLAGGLLIAVGMAKRFAEKASPFHTEYAARLAPLDFVAFIGMAYFFYMALRWRHKVHLHARYMLATVVFLLNPVIGRVLTTIPPLQINGPEQLHLFADAVRVGNVAVLALLFALFRSFPKHGKPFVEAGALVALQMFLFETLGRSSAWEQIYPGLATVNAVALAMAGLAVGALVTFAGWQTGMRRKHAPPAVVGAP
ncbi:MAG: hypothetical protein ABIW33_08320 [Sphingomicrobium sp.]